MKVLGISLGVDSGVALVDGGRLRCALNEERLSRRKFHMGFPRLALGELLRITGVAPSSIDRVVFASTCYSQPVDVNHYCIDRPTLVERVLEGMGNLGLQRLALGTSTGIALYKALGAGLMHAALPAVRRELRHLGLVAPVSFVDHHTCHASAAAFTSGWDDCLVITADQMGDGLCSAVFVKDGPSLRAERKVLVFHSLGMFYTYVTLMLGFKIGREGKIMGLAAHGDPSKTLPVFRRYVGFSARQGYIENRARGFISDYARLRRDLAPFSREDIAAGVQAHFEESLGAFARHYVERTGRRRLALAGGVFANVRVNQTLREMEGVEGTYVFPHMGDGGLAAGAALHTACRFHETAGGEPMPTLYTGPSAAREDVVADLRLFPDLCFREVDDPDGEAAALLARGRVVARFSGRMEYGPRALGNRSILCSAADASVNQWLNTRLGRTEFMPFAPTILEEDARDLLQGWDASQADSFHMTTAYDTTPLCREVAPAVVHVDGTARPQVLRAADNPSYHALIREYKRRTGLGIILNTSFNMHEEPIVCTPRDALRAFAASRLDALLLEGFRVETATGDA